MSLLADRKNFPSTSIVSLFWWVGGGSDCPKCYLLITHTVQVNTWINSLATRFIFSFLATMTFSTSISLWMCNGSFPSFCAYRPERESRHNMCWFIWSVKGWVKNLYVYTDTTLIWGTRPVNDAWILGRTHKYLQKCQSIHNLDIFIERVINFRDWYVGQKSISLT